MTRLVADLEEHLGSRLINRTTRRLSLTDTGELLRDEIGPAAAKWRDPRKPSRTEYEFGRKAEGTGEMMFPLPSP